MKLKLLFIAVLFTASSLLTSCLLIGAYDQVTDQGIQKIQTDVSGLLITLKKNLKNNDVSANAYANFSQTYNTIEGEVESLSIRSKALPKYTIVTGQIATLNANVLNLEALHKSGAFGIVRDSSVINNTMSTLEVQFTALIALQNGLKTEKN